MKHIYNKIKRRELENCLISIIQKINYKIQTTCLLFEQ